MDFQEASIDIYEKTGIIDVTPFNPIEILLTCLMRLQTSSNKPSFLCNMLRHIRACTQRKILSRVFGFKSI